MILYSVKHTMYVSFTKRCDIMTGNRVSTIIVISTLISYEHLLYAPMHTYVLYITATYTYIHNMALPFINSFKYLCYKTEKSFFYMHITFTQHSNPYTTKNVYNYTIYSMIMRIQWNLKDTDTFICLKCHISVRN